MEIVMPKSMLKDLLNEAAEIGAMKAISMCGLLKPYMSKQDAYKLYGRADVEKWVRLGQVVPTKDGQNSTKWKIDRVQIECAAKANNRRNLNLITYLNDK